MNDSTDNALKPNTILHGKSYTYTIEKKLGEGTFGITYLATTRVKVSGILGELETTLQVAIKEFFMHDLNGRAGNTVTCGSKDSIYYNYKHQFVREAQNLSRFNHPHIVKVLEAFEENDTAYFAMEFIEGGSLHEYIQKNGGLSEHEALETIMQIGEALSAMHRNKMLHLDLKPLNVMRRGNGDLVLIDFGLSKQFDENGEPESSTRIGFGTRGYAPIEQANYKRGQSFPATLDIYALGATLFKTLTGITPPEASEVFNEGFPEAEMRNCGVSDDIILLTSWAMEPMKAKRPQSVEEFLAEVRRLLPMASGETHRTTGTTDESEPTLPIKTFPDKPIYEECNGMQIRWANELSEYKKGKIRELIRHMEKIGYKERFEYTKYGTKRLVRYPLMSLGDQTWDYVYPLTQSGNTDGYFPPRNISLILNLVRQLEEWTGLPFRLAERKELRFVHTLRTKTEKEKAGTLCYSLQEGLQYQPITGYRYTKDIETGHYHPFNFFDFQLVCDRQTPVYGENFFDVSYTQRAFDEIQPIGFGLYKVRIGNRWNISSPETPMSLYLPENYESISNINIHSYTAYGGPLPLSEINYLGVVTKKGEFTTHYELNKHKFVVRIVLSKDIIKEMEMWT